jgi:hypothetical protein
MSVRESLIITRTNNVHALKSSPFCREKRQSPVMLRILTVRQLQNYTHTHKIVLIFAIFAVFNTKNKFHIQSVDTSGMSAWKLYKLKYLHSPTEAT